MTQRVTILHTNDFHNHLSAGQAQTLKIAKERFAPNCLLLDAGDAISAGNIGVRVGGEPILRLMSETGYDAMTCGNRESHLSDAILRYKIAAAEFPLLCANLTYKEQGKTDESSLPTVPYIIKDLPNGVVVGIVGVTVPMVTKQMAARHISAYIFENPLDIAARLAEELRPKVDILIALTHIGIKADRELALKAPQYDLLITGHTHLVVNANEPTGGVPIVQAGWFGKYFGQVDFDINPGTRPSISSAQILPLTEPAQ
jgi:5'-nucleotidase